MRTIYTHINNLRRKIGKAPDQDIIIKTVYKIGYKIVQENSPD